MNLLELPYQSRRVPVVGHRGIVATSQPLAALAGLDILKAGGNAVDAIIATATMLTVVEPTSNGIGGDAFALVWDGTRLHGLNGSGRAPASLTIDAVRASGHTQVPTRGWLSVTVPGAPRAWHDLHQRFGRLPFERVLEPAVNTAESGFAVSPVTARSWDRSARLFAALSGPEFAPWFDSFAIRGAAPRAGEVWRAPFHAATLRRIATSRSEDFYSGRIAERIARFSAETGGHVTLEDLAAHSSTWVEPIGVSYRDYDIWEIPPNGQGIAALVALNLLEGFDLRRMGKDSTEAYHVQLEAMKLAFADIHHYVADPEHASVPIEALLSKRYAAERRALIGDCADVREPGDPARGGTVYLCAADGEGMMVSYIQSNYSGFGSGIVIPETGIALQNRGSGFRLDPTHRNALAPRKRPFHTIIPSFLTRAGRAVGPFGVMGGHMQPQGHVQVALNTIDFDLNPQASLDAPRWQVTAGLGVLLEYGVPRHVVEGLVEKGHDVRIETSGEPFGKGQAIWRTDTGSLVAGTEPRCDGLAVCW